jgi:cytochrome P450
MAEHFHRAVHDRMTFPATAPTTLDVTELSIAYAAMIVCSAVGMPVSEGPRIALWSGAQSGLLGQHMRGRELADAVSALGWLFTMSKRTIDAGEDRTDSLAFRLREAGIPRRVAISAMANSLAAGVHTISGTIQQGTQRLLGDPARTWWNALDDEEVCARITTKVLQLDPGLVAWKRIASKAVRLNSGTILPRGPVLVMFAAANRDPNAFPDCLALNGTGKLPLTFGFGKHVCPGKSVANLAVEVFFRELRALTPDTRRSSLAESSRARKSDLLFSGADIAVTL